MNIPGYGALITRGNMWQDYNLYMLSHVQSIYKLLICPPAKYLDASVSKRVWSWESCVSEMKVTNTVSLQLSYNVSKLMSTRIETKIYVLFFTHHNCFLNSHLQLKQQLCRKTNAQSTDFHKI